ncbi:MBL fold metallo-hydrolase [Dactylosporangium sp. NPDC049140]|uniref:MBL fold metallo-hydrolase n=1 Tax=Dactylosporangium sp. NPDC049140 TaxID=3155647 RepID=UPI0033C02990
MDIERFGGPTVRFEYGGLIFVTDPTFDDPGEYPIGARVLVKLTPPLAPPPDRADVVLLSHDQHPDNLDRAGRAFLARATHVLTTPVAAARLGAGARGLEPWASADVGGVSVTAVPAQHGPDGTEHLTGPVTGFVLTAPASPGVYVSGDNASLDVVRAVAERFPGLGVAVLFGGAARTPLLGEANLTLDAAGLVAAADILGVGEVHAVHVDGWAHFTEGPAEVRAAFAAAGRPDPLGVQRGGHRG